MGDVTYVHFLRLYQCVLGNVVQVVTERYIRNIQFSSIQFNIIQYDVVLFNSVIN